MNNSYVIKVGAPLLRAGLTITTTVSEMYVVPATRMILTKVRMLNDEESSVQKEKKEPKGATLAESRRPKPTTVRIQPKHQQYSEELARTKGQPMTQRYYEEAARRSYERNR